MSVILRTISPLQTWLLIMDIEWGCWSLWTLSENEIYHSMHGEQHENIIKQERKITGLIFTNVSTNKIKCSAFKKMLGNPTKQWHLVAACITEENCWMRENIIAHMYIMKLGIQFFERKNNDHPRSLWKRYPYDFFLKKWFQKFNQQDHPKFHMRCLNCITEIFKSFPGLFLSCYLF